MRSLARAAMEDMESAKPLPAPWKIWEDNDALFYRGAVSVIAAGPGQGKTITALNLLQQIKVPTLYFSNDSTRYTIVSRAFALLSQQDIKLARVILDTKPQVASHLLDSWNHVRWDFSSQPDLEEIAMHGKAFLELYGEYPHLVVIDILMNVDHEGISEQNYWKIFPQLKDMAGDWNAAFVVVHHTSEAVKGSPCPPRSAIMGKANQLPELIITQAIVGDQVYYSVVKNRNGKSDETGETHFVQPLHACEFRIEEHVPDEFPMKFHDGPNVPEAQKINPQKQEEDW